MIKEINSEKELEDEIKENQKILLIDFFAKWCGPCKIMNPILKRFVEDNSELDLIKVDIDKVSNLVTKYEIEEVPTFILVRNEKVLRKESGILSNEELKQFVFNN